MKIQIHILHVRDRWGGQTITAHYTERALYFGLARFLLDGDDDDDEDRREVRQLIRKGEFEQANSRMGELADASGHEWTIETIRLETRRAEPAPRKVKSK